MFSPFGKRLTGSSGKHELQAAICGRFVGSL